MTAAILSTTYFGPVEWYARLAAADRVYIEARENYRKQTYRNRCVIATATGPLPLTVPVSVCHEADSRAPALPTPIRQVRLSSHGRWRQIHWNALVASYSRSPFFEFYADDIRPFFFKDRWTFLFDFNEDIRRKVCSLLDIHPDVAYTERFIPQTAARQRLQENKDYRYSITPRRPDAFSSRQRRYVQLFGRENGFLPNMSILDLLFNMGPEAVFYL